MQKVSELKYDRVDRRYVLDSVADCTAKAEHAESADELISARNKCLKPLFHFETMSRLAFVRFTLDTRNEFYSSEKDYYDETAPEISAEYVKFQKAFLNNPYIKEAEKNIGSMVVKQYELSVKCTCDEVVPYRVEENKIITEYTKLMAETLYELNGKKMPLATLRKYFAATDRNIRKLAYEVLGNTLASIGDKLDDIFDRLVKVRTAAAKILGYDNFAELGDNLLGRISYNRRDIRAFRENVLRDIVPAVTELKKGLAKSLGIKNFMLYDNDTYFANGNPEPVISADKMFDAAKEMYHDMSRETGEFFDMMLNTEAFDVFPREGKWGGGYMEEFVDYSQPFILANFNGTIDDVTVLTHEAGHAFNSYMSFLLGHDHDITPGMETAETHSMSMEFLCHKYMDKFFGERSEDFKYAHIFDALTFIPYGTIVDYFQEQVYSRPEMTPAERNKLWKKLESEFRPWLTTDGIPYLENGTRWQYQMHIYESPMYYIDYCLAQSVALQFYLMSRNEYGKALNSYFEFVKTVDEFPTLVKNAGLNSPFESGALSEIATSISEILKK